MMAMILVVEILEHFLELIMFIIHIFWKSLRAKGRKATQGQIGA